MMSKEEMAQLKMEIELELLKAKLQKEKKDAKPSWLGIFFDRTNKWIALTIAVVSMLAGIWGLIIPAKNYFDERQKQMHYDLSKDMIGFAHKLRDSVTANQQDAVLLLSYFDLNSMPILLYKLETLDNDEDEAMIDHVIKSMSLIYMRNHKDVTAEVIYYFRNIFKQSNSVEKWSRTKYSSLKNYGELINKIEFEKSDSRKIIKMIDYMLKVLDADEDLARKMRVFKNSLIDFKEYYTEGII